MIVDIPGHAEVADFDGRVRGHHAIARGQVAMAEFERLEVRHAVRDLRRPAEDLRRGGRRQVLRVLLRVRTA